MSAFRVYFFEVISGSEKVEKILEHLAETKNITEKIYFSYGKKCRFVKCEKDKFNSDDIFLGDLQSMHEKNLPKFLKIDEYIEETDFKENEGLGYNNCFVYYAKLKLLLLQNNSNGVGFRLLKDILNNFPLQPNIEDEIELSVVCDTSPTDLSNIDDLTEFKFAVSNWRNADSFSWFGYKENEGYKIEYVNVELKNKIKPLKKEMVDNTIKEILKDGDCKIKKLKVSGLLEGENVELNFLQHKFSYLEYIELAKFLKYDVRKKAIENAIRFYFKKWNKDTTEKEIKL